MTDQEIIDALMKAAVHCVGMDIAHNGRTFRTAAERIRVLGEECEAGRHALSSNHVIYQHGEPKRLSEVHPKLHAARAATDAARGGTR